MVTFDINLYADQTGWIRLCNVKNFDKFCNILKRMSTGTSVDPENNLYKDFSTSMTEYTVNGCIKYDFSVLCPAEVFTKRVLSSMPTGKVIYSSYDANTGKRSNMFINVLKYDYTNMHRAYPQTIVVHYVDYITDDYNKLYINVSELCNCAVRRLTDSDEDVLKQYKAIVNSKPSPLYKYMEIKKEYVNDYGLYLDDCKKYGFTPPVNKRMLTKMNLDDHRICFLPDGTMGGDCENDDVEIVNI